MTPVHHSPPIWHRLCAANSDAQSCHRPIFVPPPIDWIRPLRPSVRAVRLDFVVGRPYVSYRRAAFCYNRWFQWIPLTIRWADRVVVSLYTIAVQFRRVSQSMLWHAVYSICVPIHGHQYDVRDSIYSPNHDTIEYYLIARAAMVRSVRRIGCLRSKIEWFRERETIIRVFRIDLFISFLGHRTNNETTITMLCYYESTTARTQFINLIEINANYDTGCPLFLIYCHSSLSELVDVRSNKNSIETAIQTRAIFHLFVCLYVGDDFNLVNGCTVYVNCETNEFPFLVYFRLISI